MWWESAELGQTPPLHPMKVFCLLKWEQTTDGGSVVQGGASPLILNHFTHPAESESAGKHPDWNPGVTETLTKDSILYC